MRYDERIYCIEGYWDWGEDQIEPSVEPILQMLQKMGLWNYARRDCATQPELEFWLENEWQKCCTSGSILYIATHGSRGSISLGSDVNEVTLSQLTTMGPLDCEKCLVHFNGCEIFAGEGRTEAQNFIQRTGASFVTGYSKSGYWLSEQWAPAVALDLILFSSIRDAGIDFKGQKSLEPMRELVKRLKQNKIFEECGLELFTKWGEN